MNNAKPVNQISFKGMFLGILLAVIVVACMACFYTIDTGERGVVLRFGKLINVVGEGLNFKVPVMDDVKIMSVRDQN